MRINVSIKNKTCSKKHKANIGISFDGDADRIIMCDEKGKMLLRSNNCNVSQQVEIKENT